jgi:mono/diheme cytochrome c family protein
MITQGTTKENTVNRKTFVSIMLLMLTVAACSADAGNAEDPSPIASESTQVVPSVTEASAAEQGDAVSIMPGRGMGPRSGMMARHHATVPEPYAGLTNNVPADAESLDRGAELYSSLCASCHGDGGMGDGPAGASLDPAPAPVAHSSQMLGDDMLFWRISEGGTMPPFSSAMPPWKDSLDEESRWDLVNYVRALGQGQVMPREAAGGVPYDPAAELAQRAEMLAAGVEQGVITQAEADRFDEVHSAMDELAVSSDSERMGGMDRIRDVLLAELVDSGIITQDQIDAFNDVHDRLAEAGLMD